MTLHLYTRASSPTDCHDAALLCLLWHLLSRASDVSQLRKQNLTVGAGGVFFVRFIWMKTSEEQGLTLMPDVDFATCPLLSLALVLASQAAPSSVIFSNLSKQHTQALLVTP